MKTEENFDRIKEINSFLDRPDAFRDEKLRSVKGPRGISYILQRAEGKKLIDAHKIFLENPIIEGVSINRIVDQEGIEIPRGVAFIDSGCACGNDKLGICMSNGRYILGTNAYIGGESQRRNLRHWDIPTLLTYGPLFQGIEVSLNCGPMYLHSLGILSHEEANSLEYGGRKRTPLEKQVKFLTRKMLEFCNLQLTAEQAKNFHVIPTRR
jgi:hypothetical protein